MAHKKQKFDFTILFKELEAGSEKFPELSDADQSVDIQELNKINELRKIVVETTAPQQKYYTLT